MPSRFDYDYWQEFKDQLPLDDDVVDFTVREVVGDGFEVTKTFECKPCTTCKKQFPTFALVSGIAVHDRCRPCNEAKAKHDRARRGAVCSFCGATYDWCCC